MLIQKQLERRCAWCDKENGFVAQGNVTHGLCDRHYQDMLLDLELIEAKRRAQTVYDTARQELAIVQGLV